MSQSPSLAVASNLPISLSRVQRADPLCCELLDQAGPCALYQHSQDRWVKCHHSSQGRLVLYRRSTAPLNAFAVLGCGQDRVQPLPSGGGGGGGFCIQSRPPFLLFGPQQQQQLQGGVWFRDDTDCERLAQRMAGLMAATSQIVGTATQQRQLGIVDMLGKAQAEFEAAAAAEKARMQQQQQQQLVILVGADGASGSNSAGGDACELVARRIRQQLGLAQPEENKAAVPVAEDAPGCSQQQDRGLHPSHLELPQPPSTSPPPAEEEFLLTPGMLESLPTSPSRSQPDGEDSEQVVTREQLRQSLVHLLEHDDGFISSVHRAYIASLQRRLTKI